MAVRPTFSDDDYQAILGVNKNGMHVSTPRDDAMKQVNQAQAMAANSIGSSFHDNSNMVATDSMRQRGLNVGFNDAPNPMAAVDKMKNGLARNTGKTKDQLFGGSK